MSKKRVETWTLGLWRVLTFWVRARQAWQELRPGRELYSLGWSRPLDRAMAETLTVITVRGFLI